jgi:hypothetical protein
MDTGTQLEQWGELYAFVVGRVKEYRQRQAEREAAIMAERGNPSFDLANLLSGPYADAQRAIEQDPEYILAASKADAMADVMAQMDAEDL